MPSQLLAANLGRFRILQVRPSRPASLSSAVLAVVKRQQPMVCPAVVAAVVDFLLPKFL
jgi:hypothetical protein